MTGVQRPEQQMPLALGCISLSGQTFQEAVRQATYEQLNANRAGATIQHIDELPGRFRRAPTLEAAVGQDEIGRISLWGQI